MASADPTTLRRHLQDAVIKCSERGLFQSAKWAAEMLSSLASDDDDDDDDDDDLTPTTDADPDLDSMSNGGNAPAAPAPQDAFIISQRHDPIEAALEAREAHRYLLAKSFFDCREFDRCAAVFLPSAIPLGLASVIPQKTTGGGGAAAPASPSPEKGKGKSVSYGPAAAPTAAAPKRQNPYPKLSQKALFLALYAKYMAGEKRKNEESEMVLGPADGGMVTNRELPDLASGLEGWFAERADRGLADQEQGWLEYLYGIIMAKGKNEKAAKEWLLKAVHRYPFNWGAWLELNDLIENMEELQTLAPRLPQNCMALMFYLHCSQENYQTGEETHRQLAALEDIFPTSSFLRTQRALLLYHCKDFDEAAQIFASLLHQDPYRLDALDHYSNILYVMSARPQLAFIAQLATAVDKFRPETCCVVGNYYALKSEHEKACQYFRRALTLDRNFLSAWTLMGHEYIEMKNTHAAIESYRRAVDVNRKDYRAWYGLGQAYEVLEMSFYALFYYQKAASLRPFDAKMWQAVGSCYAKMGRPIMSIKALKRALVAGSYFETVSSQPNHRQPPAVATSFGSSTSTRRDGGASGGGPVAARRVLDPETLHQIASMYERLGDMEECAAYMELVLAQEGGVENDDDDLINRSEDGSDGGGIRLPRAAGGGSGGGGGGERPEASGGTGVTQTTSKARLWLAKWAFQKGDEIGLKRAYVLAEELCQDGMEVEEAKGIMRDVRGRREGIGV